MVETASINQGPIKRPVVVLQEKTSNSPTRCSITLDPANMGILTSGIKMELPGVCFGHGDQFVRNLDVDDCVEVISHGETELIVCVQRGNAFMVEFKHPKRGFKVVITDEATVSWSKGPDGPTDFSFDGSLKLVQRH